MISLNIFILFLLNKIAFSLKNKFNNIPDNKINMRFLDMIPNIPVENNIPIIIVQDINKFDNNSSPPPNPIIIPIIIPDNNKVKIITNTSIKINTTKMDPMCTPECCAGCRVQFQKLAAQKICITNICKCQIIEINTEKINDINGINNNIKEEKTLLLLNNLENDFSYFYYSFVIFLFIIYEICILYIFNYKGKEFNYNNTFQNDKESRIRDYMDLLYDDEELIECLI